VERLVVNTHHLASQIEAHLEKWRWGFQAIHISHEPTILGVGGGIRAALPLLDASFFWVVNGDVLTRPSGRPTVFEHMEKVWVPRPSQALLALIPRQHAWGYTGKGDFCQAPDGTLTLVSPQAPNVPFVYGGIQILSPRCVEASLPSSSILPIWKQALAQGELRGASWDGEWFHVGTKDAFEAIQQL
jgi:MurNAc alpha-1-phosphate uridylyltransferase